MFIIVALSILVALDLFWILGALLIQRRSAKRSRWFMVTLIFIGSLMAGLAGVLIQRGGGGVVLPGYGKAGIAFVFIWHLVLLPVFVSTLWIGLGSWGILRLVRYFTRRAARATPEVDAPAIHRREFLAAAVAIAPPAMTAAATAAGLVQISGFRIRRLAIPIPGLPAALDGLTIAHLSDSHVGPFTSGKILNAMVEAANGLEPDLAVFTGDLINSSLVDLPEGLRLLKSIRAKHGVHVIEGNHDLFENAREFERRVRDAGLSFLINEAANLEINGTPLQLLGLRWGGLSRNASRQEQHGDAAIQASMEELLRLRKPEAFPILLAHHPHAFDWAAEAGVPLTLSGHTHGGQLMVNQDVGFGPLLFRYWSGLYSKKDSRLVVSNGVGNWFPLRVSAPAEIVHLTLLAVGGKP